MVRDREIHSSNLSSTTANTNPAMIEHLFVYGTLGPGRPNEHVLTKIGGTWKNATINGVLHNEGWGSELGYPAIELSNSGDVIEGFLFTSKHLSNNWDKLDEFEGQAYRRVIANVKLDNGTHVDANIYTLRSN